MPRCTSTETSPFGASGARKISVSTLRASVTSSASSTRVGLGVAELTAPFAFSAA
jgi:hypothetical protein